MEKILIVLISLFISSNSFAEHDATYCGRLISGDQGQSYGENPLAILVIGYQELVSVWPNEYDEVDGYAAIVSLNNPIAEQNLKKFLKTAKPTTRICVKGRWGGSLYSGSLNDISLNSDSVDRIDYASKLEGTE